MIGIETRKVCVMTTAHISVATRYTLNSKPMSEWPVAGGRMPFGYMLWAPEEIASDREIPDDLLTLFTWARDRGFEYILFDSDAEEVQGLRVYPGDAAETPFETRPDVVRHAKALELLRDGRDLIDDAMSSHIYDESMGEEPDEDCSYSAHLREVRQFLGEPAEEE